MIDGQRLLADLQPVRRRLEADLLERSEQLPELGQRLRDDWQSARKRERTAQTYETWRDDTLAQASVMWVLACVFVRFLEDNGLLAPNQPRLAGQGAALQLARDQRTLYFQKHPLASDRDYLYNVFEAASALPAAGPLFDTRHNPIWNIGLSGDAATDVIEFWQRIDPETGALVHDFTDPEWQTRFLGDLYQDLSESARKKYALLQTPDFVLQFILDRTLTPAIEEFGFREVRLVDPACGSGHFLLAAFERLFRHWSQSEPGRNARELAQRALEQVSGVDLNPFAVAIARFRLLLAALRASSILRLSDAPAFTIDVAAGDSLLHGPRPRETWGTQRYLDPETDPLQHVYATEDAEDLKRILGRRYHVVVGNPPYITPKDSALNKAYRERFGSCHMKYSLAVPFTERLFDLAIEPALGDSTLAGYVGMITANSFMKREFGKKLIEEYIPRWALTHVIDTSGAYIPGHGTPTVILFGRHRQPMAAQPVRAVLGIKGEPITPDEPAQGLVWRAIVDQTDRPSSSSAFISVSDTERSSFQKHPWSIGGGGAAELKSHLEDSKSSVLGSHVESVGFSSFPGTDDAFVAPATALTRFGVPNEYSKPFIFGESVRDWAIAGGLSAFVPYGKDLKPISYDPAARWARRVWPLRTTIGNTMSFGGRTRLQNGDLWWTWYRWIPERYRRPLSITFAEVATHNHFVLDRGGKVFNQTAPVVKLPADATEDDHFALLGLLNSSTACFWMKQVAHQKQLVGGDGVRVEFRSKVPYQFSGTQLGELPIPPRFFDNADRARVTSLARRIDSLARELNAKAPRAVLERSLSEGNDLRAVWQSAIAERERIRRAMVTAQEELDYKVYEIYGLIGSAGAIADDEPIADAGERPFEIVAGSSQDGHIVPRAVPSSWPESLKRIWERRSLLIRDNPMVGLIEDPHYKRRWIGRQGLFNHSARRSEWDDALQNWLHDRLETDQYWPATGASLTTTAKLSDLARRDSEFMQVAEAFRGHSDFDVAALVTELVTAEAVPHLPVLRYSETGMRKRAQWERTWELQRQEDAIDTRVDQPEGDGRKLTQDQATKEERAQLGDIQVPPKYTAEDFRKGDYWRLRGKLDVPKERFVSYPLCERDADPTPVVAWAGWDHLQQAKALATYYVQMKESEGWGKERLIPLLGGLLELLPWLMQWHNNFDAEYGQCMGEYFEGFVDEEARTLGLTRDAIRAWVPPSAASRRRGRRTPLTEQ